MLPYGGLERDRPLFRVPFTHLAVGTVMLPFGGLLVCLAVALKYHYHDATYTHCEVTNYLPSISSAISRVPERYIWRGFIGLHSAPRYLVSAAYFCFYRRQFGGRTLEQLLSALTLLLSLTENTGLLVLTYVGSTETYEVHKYGFIMFIGSALLHMLTTLRLWFVIQRHSLHSEEVTSYRWKLRLFLSNIFCCGCAFYFFRRHNKYCEHGVYTLFALFEYLVVFSNMAFHMTALWDFRSQEVMVSTPSEDKRY
ncbi:post-GPI attachment to proteins factor 2 [Eucyclogobius newberryi]|uniref:post-GPI attachment to proteins factor 2 n=1 Tax=Eucyclogobius newberryi TaxID=166745 RepID=UPI003B5A7D07